MMEAQDDSVVGHRGFGWQYLHVIGRQTAANVVFHQTDIFGEHREPYVSLGYNSREGRGHVRLPVHSLNDSFAPSGDLRFDDRYGVFRTKDGFTIDVLVGPLQLAGAVTLTAPLPPPRPTILLREGRRTNHWAVLAAGAEFSGTLRVHGLTQDCSGAFYMDRQWGDLLLQQIVQDWVWGHFVASGVSMVFFHILTVHGTTVGRSEHSWADVWHGDAGVQESHLPGISGVRELGRLRASFKIGLVASGSPTEIHFSVQPKDLMRFREAEAHVNFVTTYARWRVSGVAHRGGDAMPVEGVTEYLRIRGG